MRRTRVWQIVVWVLLALAAAAALAAGCLGLPPWLRWSLAAVLAAVDAVWIAAHFALGRRPSGPAAGASFADSGIAASGALALARQATASYLSTVAHSGLLLKRALYARPWFLVLGPEGAGKTALIERSGLAFPLRHPAEPVAAPRHAWERVRWHFADQGAWIDTPGSMLDAGGADAWRALAAALQTVRPKRPVDGVVAVVDASGLLETDEAGVRRIAEGIRRRLDDIIAAWGVEVPVYLVVSHADVVDGFERFFTGPGAPGRDEVFGATLSLSQRAASPRQAMLEEFRTLAQSLADCRIERLAKGADDEDRRSACRFTVQFLSLEEKLGALATELFRASSFVGKPVLAGFYFTGSPSQAETEPEPAGADGKVAISEHPLNPHRAASEPAAAAAEAPSLLFALPLLRMLMTEERLAVRSTTRRIRAGLVRAIAANAVAALVAAGLLAGLVVVRRHTGAVLAQAELRARQAAAADASLEQRYRTLGALAEAVDALDRRQGMAARLTAGQTGPAREALRAALALRLRKSIAVPGVMYLEREIESRAALSGELSGDTYDELYGLLRTYLSISEAGSERVAELDVAGTGAVLKEAATRTLTAALGGGRLPAEVEAVVNAGVPRYLTYLKEKRCSLLQPNQRLVQDARARLRRLPGAATLYRTMIEHLAPSGTQLGLNDVLERTGGGALVSGAVISSLYTPEGWQRQVSSALAKAAAGQRTVDWVVGEAEALSSSDTAGLAAGMLAAYAADYRDQWLVFLDSIKVQPTPGLTPSARALRAVSTRGGELETLLRRVKELTAVEAVPGLGAAADAATAKAQAIVAERAPDVAAGAATAAGAIRRPRGPFAAVASVFGPLAVFVEEGSGRPFALAGYCERVAAVSQRIETIAQATAEQTLAAFNGSPDDPLLAAWRYTRSGLDDLPEPLARALSDVLAGPLDMAGAEVSKVLGTALNARWTEEVAKPFAYEIAGRYPMSRRGVEAPYSDVTDFFRPGAGVFWGFFDRMLSPYVVRGRSGWNERALGCVRLDFSPSLDASLTAAQRIRDMLFTPNGQERTFQFMIAPPSRGRPAELEVSGLKTMLTPGGPPARVEWPMRSQVQSARLAVQLADGSMREVAFDGEWGFMRLMQSGSIRALNRSAFVVTWKINVQNIYTIEQPYRVDVSGGDNPFVEALFEKFDCPSEIVVAGRQ